jgi:fluoroquinolone resistance protein
MSAHQFFVDQLMAGNKNLQHASLEEIDLSNKTFTGVDFTSANLSETTLHGTTFKNCILSGAKLGRCDFKDTNFINCTMLTTQLQLSKGNVHLFKCKAIYAEFSGCDLQRSTFDESNLTGAYFNIASLDNSSFMHNNLNGVSFREASLERSTIINNSFKDAIFMNTDMSGVRANKNKNVTPEQLEGFKDSKYTSIGIIGAFLVSDSHPNVYMINKYYKRNQSVELINVETMKKYKRKLRVSSDLERLYVKDKFGNEYRIVDKRPKSVPYI